MDLLPVRRALLSVTDKNGLVELGRYLHDGGVELVSTGGTYKKLQEAGLPVTAVSDVTGFPEILDGRVKTLHPRIHGGVLADKDNPQHLAALQKHDIVPFDLVCVNLYNFARAARQKLALPDAVEQIDIGGPTLLRAGAKNFHSLVVIPSTDYYEELRQELETQNMRVSLPFRQKMAATTFALVSQYDSMIASYLGGGK